MSDDVWTFTSRVWPAKRIGWRWSVTAVLNGRPDPSAPTGYPWALTYAAACRRSQRKVHQREWEKNRTPEEWATLCSVVDCDNAIHSYSMCGRHAPVL